MHEIAPPPTGRHALHACFLGPYGENDVLLERLVVEFLRDHVYWRRNFHPEDPPAIPTHAAQSPGSRRRWTEAVQTHRLEQLGLVAFFATLDPDTLGGDNDDRLLILRHTLMNPYFIDRENDISYIDQYFRFLARRTRALMALEPAA